MKAHLLEREQHVPAPPEEVFAFFADALNLEAITPPWLRFRVVTPAPIEMRPGALIEYRLAPPPAADPLAHPHRGVETGTRLRGRPAARPLPALAPHPHLRGPPTAARWWATGCATPSRCSRSAHSRSRSCAATSSGSSTFATRDRAALHKVK